MLVSGRVLYSDSCLRKYQLNQSFMICNGWIDAAAIRRSGWSVGEGDCAATSAHDIPRCTMGYGGKFSNTSLMKSRKTADFADHIVSLSISSLTGVTRVSMLSIESLSLVCQDTCQPPTRIKRIPIA